jgi:hypothetical protein
MTADVVPTPVNARLGWSVAGDGAPDAVLSGEIPPDDAVAGPAAAVVGGLAEGNW